MPKEMECVAGKAIRFNKPGVYTITVHARMFPQTPTPRKTIFDDFFGPGTLGGRPGQS